MKDQDNNQYRTLVAQRLAEVEVVNTEESDVGNLESHSDFEPRTEIARRLRGLQGAVYTVDPEFPLLDFVEIKVPPYMEERFDALIELGTVPSPPGHEAYRMEQLKQRAGDKIIYGNSMTSTLRDTVGELGEDVITSNFSYSGIAKRIDEDTIDEIVDNDLKPVLVIGAAAGASVMSDLLRSRLHQEIPGVLVVDQGKEGEYLGKPKTILIDSLSALEEEQLPFNGGVVKRLVDDLRSGLPTEDELRKLNTELRRIPDGKPKATQRDLGNWYQRQRAKKAKTENRRKANKAASKQRKKN